MSKNKNKKRRDTIDIANRGLPFSDYVTVINNNFPDDLRLYEDRREYHPDRVPSAATRTGRDYILRERVKKRRRPSNASVSSGIVRHDPIVHRIGFEQPEKVAICVRRSIRREVLHARKKTGKRGQKKAKWNFYSRVSCKR